MKVAGRTGWWMGSRILAAGLLCLGGTAAGPPSTSPPGESMSLHRSSPYRTGLDIFNSETFAGNGRTCATCHDPRAEFTISPELVERRFQQDPEHPLFRPLDSDDGEGADYTTLRRHALFKVPLDLHPALQVAGEPLRRRITVLRATPSIANVALTAPFQWDGRKATLEEQAAGAIDDHMQPGRAPRQRELRALGVFQSELFSPLRLRALLDAGDDLPLEPEYSMPRPSAAAARGREMFFFFCSRCHGGETAGEPPVPGTPQFHSVLISEINAHNLPAWDLVLRLDDGREIRFTTPDPGRVATSGQLQDLNAFQIPSLRGLRHTAPYFHDHSVLTLRDVVRHYVVVLSLPIGPSQQADLVAFLETL